VALCLGAFAWDAALRLRKALGGHRPAPAGAQAATKRAGELSAGAPAQRRAERSTAVPRPRFGHGAEHAAEPFPLIGCFHPSQQNTFTGRLTAAMIDTVLARTRELAELRSATDRSHK
jgi:uracil-DNA glycosylase